MSEGLNRVILLGNLTADPELRHTNGGTGVLNLRLATSERYKGKDGSWQDRTEYHAIVVWGARGEALSRILNKGDRVAVEGGLRTSSYEAKDGSKRYKTEIVASSVLLNGRGSGGGDAPGRRAPGGIEQGSSDHEGADSFTDDDIPF